MPKIFSKSGETDFSLFRAFRPGTAGFKQNKSPAAHHRPRNDPVTSWPNQPRRCPDNGASDGDFRSLARMACRRACLRHGLVRTCRPDLTAGTLDSPGAAEADREIRRAVRAFRGRAVRGRLAGKMAGRRAQARRRKGATGALRRRPRALRVSGRPAISRHCGCRAGPRGPRPPRRDQSRDQSGDPADERSGPIRRNRRLEFAAGHLRPWRRRLRGLRDRKIRRLAPGRHRRRRSADRDHARHHPRRGPRRRRRAAGRALADAGQSPHGDGRGRAMSGTTGRSL